MPHTKEACLELLADIPGNFPAGDEKFWVGTTPEKALGSIETGMALMAVSLSGSPDGVEINMRLPRLNAELRKLAGNDPGYNIEYNRVRFMFVELADGKLGVSMGLEEL